MKTPTELVKSFIADYFDWNSYALSLSSNAQYSKRQVIELAEQKYAELLKEYCLPGFEGMAIAYGSESVHAPDKEVVVSEEIVDSKAVVRTAYSGRHSFVARFEYRLAKHSSRWYLEAVDYMNGEGKYPSF